MDTVYILIGFFAVAVLFMFIGAKIMTEHQEWREDSYKRQIDSLKVKVFDLESMRETNDQYAKTIRALVLKYGSVDGDWKGYGYERLKIDLEGLDFIPISRDNIFHAQGTCTRGNDKQYRLGSSMTVELRAHRDK